MKDPFHPEKNPLARREDGLLKDYQRPSADLIHEAVMRAGGVPFLEPFEIGVLSLTERVVRLFRQMGFFGFEWLDQRLRQRSRRNKFTRYGAARFRGDYPPELLEQIAAAVEARRRQREEEAAAPRRRRWFGRR